MRNRDKLEAIRNEFVPTLRAMQAYSTQIRKARNLVQKPTLPRVTIPYATDEHDGEGHHENARKDGKGRSV